jgi:signal peptidase I
MQPTYADHEFAIASKDVDVLRRGDVVVVDGPNGPIIKRIAYLPGDKIKYVFFGGEWMIGSDRALRTLKHPEKFPARTVTVPLNHVYVLGDNWLVSIDSRQFGVVPIANITAKLPNAKPKSDI